MTEINTHLINKYPKQALTSTQEFNCFIERQPTDARHLRALSKKSVIYSSAAA